MYTSFVTDTRKAISDCWNSVQDIHKQQAQNDTRYQGEYLTEQNKRLDEQKKAACEAARKKIASICDKADEDAATLDTLNPFAVSDDYLKLLSGAFDLTIPQVQHIATECQTSPTMLSAVDAYCKRNGMKLNRATAESRRSGVSEIRASALSVVSRIEKTNYKNLKADFSTPLVVSSFCENSDAASELCGRLGQRFEGELITPTVTKAEPFNFHFKGVRDTDKKAD